MPNRRAKKAARKVDRLLGRNRDEVGRNFAESFGWTHAIEHPSKADLAANKKKPPLPRTRE